MQIEIKLRLKDATAHERVAEALKPHLITTHKQENIFFDGSENELSNTRTIVRTRFYNRDQRCLLTIKVSHCLVSCSLLSFLAQEAPHSMAQVRTGTLKAMLAAGSASCQGWHWQGL